MENRLSKQLWQLHLLGGCRFSNPYGYGLCTWHWLGNRHSHCLCNCCHDNLRKTFEITKFLIQCTLQRLRWVLKKKTLREKKSSFELNVFGQSSRFLYSVVMCCLNNSPVWWNDFPPLNRQRPVGQEVFCQFAFKTYCNWNIFHRVWGLRLSCISDHDEKGEKKQHDSSVTKKNHSVHWSSTAQIQKVTLCKVSVLFLTIIKCSSCCVVLFIDQKLRTLHSGKMPSTESAVDRFVLSRLSSEVRQHTAGILWTRNTGN